MIKPSKKDDGEHFDEELYINSKFYTFCSHLHNHVLGKNTVAYQCGQKELHLAKKGKEIVFVF